MSGGKGDQTVEMMGERLTSMAPSVAASLGPYDVAIVGAGVAGSALASSLARSGRRVLLVERDLAPPDRIVGELLQPGGCLSLQKLGLVSCLDGIDSRSVRGYQVYWGTRSVPIPYPDRTIEMGWKEDGTSGRGPSSLAEPESSQEGRSFHHGQFIDSLRRRAAATPGVTLVEGTVTDLSRDEAAKVIGFDVVPSSKARFQPGITSNGSAKGPADVSEIFNFRASLTVVADGCFSKFRKVLLPADATPVVRSNFVGLLLEDADLPSPGKGHVILRKPGSESAASESVGPVLVYQLGERETRMLVDVPHAKLPSISNGDLRAYLERTVLPSLPASLEPSFKAALQSSSDPSKPQSRLRSMPNSWLPAHPQHRLPRIEGCLLMGDALNMRHPLTGGGMTVALNDVVILTELFGGGKSVGSVPASEPLDLEDHLTVRGLVEEWFWRRKAVSGTVNVLAQALYCLFGADDESLEILKMGCFQYFNRGGECVQGPVSLLSALRPSPTLLFYHFFSVALYSICLLFTTPMSVSNKDAKRPAPTEWPRLFLRSLVVFWTACKVFVPVLWSEITLF